MEQDKGDGGYNAEKKNQNLSFFRDECR